MRLRRPDPLLRRARAILAVPVLLALCAGAACGVPSAPAWAEAVPLPPSRPTSPAAQPKRDAGAGKPAGQGTSAGRPRSAPLPPLMPEEILAYRASAAAAAEVEDEQPAARSPAGPRIAYAPTQPQGPEEIAADDAAADDAARAAASGPMPAACAALVARGILAAEPASGLAVKAGCAPVRPLRVSAVQLEDGSRVELRPAAVIQCNVAAEVVDWVREDIAPAIAAMGTRLKVVKVAASYECRPRNRQAGARMSEHGSANVLDVGGFEVADGRRLAVVDTSFPLLFQEQMKASACRRFTTVLGPGSDGYHEDHVHVDLARRARDFRLCRWRLKGGPAAVASAPSRVSPAAPSQPGESKDGDGPDAAPESEADAPEASAVPLPPRRPRF